MRKIINGIISKMKESKPTCDFRQYRMLCQSLYDYIVSNGSDLYEDELIKIENDIAEEKEWFYQYIITSLSDKNFIAPRYKDASQIHILLERLYQTVQDIGISKVIVSGESVTKYNNRKKR